MKLTGGPRDCNSLNGRKQFVYRVLRQSQFDVELQTSKPLFSGDVTIKRADGETRRESEPSLAELAKHTKPAVVYSREADKTGTGFFVTDTGIVATNARLVRGEESRQAELSDGRVREAKVVYADSDLDIALAKEEGQGLPRLTLRTPPQCIREKAASRSGIRAMP